jgi:hypothetical protein
MSNRAKIEAMIDALKTKIEALTTDFANGKLNRDQFHAVYSKYSAEMAIAEQAINGLNMPNTMAQDDQSTIAILEAHMGKAIGVGIYHDMTRQMIDTLGEFDAPIARVIPILDQMMASSKVGDQRTEKMSFNRWLLFIKGHHSTIVTLFKNEPSPMQCREMERLLRDFELANAQAFGGGPIDNQKLAYPFLSFIQRKVRRQP